MDLIFLSFILNNTIQGTVILATILYKEIR